MGSIRASVEARVTRERGIVVVFIESVCDDPDVIAANVALKVSSGDPDYADTSPEEAKFDFLRRIKQYEAVYQTISEAHLSYLKIINVGSQVILNRINGYLQSRIAFYLMNLHLKPRSIFFSRHGESQFNVEGKIGGDSALSSRGMRYARALPELITDNIGNSPLTVSVIYTFSIILIETCLVRFGPQHFREPFKLVNSSRIVSLRGRP